MADTKTSALTALAGSALAADDLFPVVDTSTVTTKSIRSDQLLAAGSAILAVPTYWTANNAAAAAWGPNGNTNPVLRVITNVASQADGISITGGAAGAGTTIAALSSGSNSPIVLTPKGTGSVIVPTGTAANPAVAFAGGTTTGLKLSSTIFVDIVSNGSTIMSVNNLGPNIGSGKQFTFSSNADPAAAFGDTGLKRASAGVVQVTDGSSGAGKLLLGQGASSAPAIAYASQVNTGFYFVNTAAMGYSTNGVVTFVVGTNFVLKNSAELLWASGDPAATAADTGLKRAGAGVVQVTDGSTGAGVLLLGPGSVSAPSVANTAQTNTGIHFNAATNGTRFVTAGLGIVEVGNGVGINVKSDYFVAWCSSTIGSAADVGLARAAAGVLKVNNGSSGTGAFLSARLVEANTAGSGAPNILTAIESGTVLTNEGATAENYHTLPTAVAGYEFLFIVQDADGLRVTAAAGDTIRDLATVSATAGFIRSTVIGSTLRLISINATEWVVVSKTGTWTVDV